MDIKLLGERLVRKWIFAGCLNYHIDHLTTAKGKPTLKIRAFGHFDPLFKL